MKTSTAVAFSTAGLLGLSVWVVLKGAGDEPYTRFQASEAFVQIGVASALMALWLVLVGFISVQVSKKSLHPAWLASLALCVIALYALCDLPTAYVADLVNFGAVN